MAMIEINLLPGTKAKPKVARQKIDFGALFAGVGDRFKDPWLAVAVISVLVAGGIAGTMWQGQRATELELRERETKAVRDSGSYHGQLMQLQLAEAQQDSLLKQLGAISAIDQQRYIWPHILDEIARALPMYTWLRSVAQSSAAVAASADQIAADSLPALGVRVVGVTVDVQALTVFMTQLEASPYFSDVNLAVSSVTQVEGKEVNEFTLDLRYSRPDPVSLQMVPLTLQVP